MFALFAPIARFFSPNAATLTVEVARRLLESAGARSGQDPRNAEELRSAAVAYLSVVR